MTGRPLLIALAAVFVAAGCDSSADLIIRGGAVVDGSGSEAERVDVAVRGQRIVAVGDLSAWSADRLIDATGMMVAPGFIDVHSHAGPALETVELAHAEPLLRQGITTVMVNPDGGGPVDVAAQADRISAVRPAIHVGLLVPHGSVRRAVIGMADRPPTTGETERMKALAREGMEWGAFGVSSGLYYAPGFYATTDEVTAIAAEAAPFDGVYTSHIRDESTYSIGLDAAVDEVITVARDAGVTGVVTHIKALGPDVWGAAPRIARRIEEARTEGIAVWADQYPYEASATGLVSALVDRSEQAGGTDSLLARMARPGDRARIRAAMSVNLARRGGAERIQFRRHEPDPSIEGRRLSDLAEERGQDPLDTALALIEAGGAGIVSFNMDSADVRTFMRQPWTMTSSDGGFVPFGQGVPHPRNYGTFPRKLGRYVRDEGVMPLEDALYSMTGLPADVFGVTNRGRIAAGMWADIVIFDLDALHDPATFTDPHRLAEGMTVVMVNGCLAIEDGRLTDSRCGTVLRKGRR